MLTADNQTEMQEKGIGIVTAFFDIGRGDWTPEKNHPSHLVRTTDTYFERFARLAALDNELVVYTSPDLAPRVEALRKGKENRTVVVPFPLFEVYKDKRDIIRRVQNDPAFISKINPAQIKNPEYWNPDYILVTNLKTTFVAHAVKQNLIRQPMVAWVDFGIMSHEDTLKGCHVWDYPFVPDKIHLMAFSHYRKDISIPQVVANNVAFIAGGVVVASRDQWPFLAQLANLAIEELLKYNLVDDDQTIMLLAYLMKPDMFELHLIGSDDWTRMLDLFHV